jgi:DNA-binding MarR family transcriptional regulator
VFDPPQCSIVGIRAQFDVDLVTDLVALASGVASGGDGRTAWPNVVVTDDAPASDTELSTHPTHCGFNLKPGRLTGEEYPGCSLSAFVERRVDVWDAAAEYRGQGLAYCGDVPPRDRVDLTGGDEGVDLLGNHFGGSTTIDDDKVHPSAQGVVLGVDLLDGQFGTQLTGRSEHPGGALQRDDKRDDDVGGVFCSTMSDQHHAPALDGKIEVLRSLDRALSAAFRDSADLAVTTHDQWRVLLTLRDGDGHTMSDVAEQVGVPAATATRLVDGLVARTLVYRRSDPLDRRKVLVYLNPIHRDALDAVTSRAWAILAAAVDELSEAGREALNELLVDAPAVRVS